MKSFQASAFKRVAQSVALVGALAMSSSAAFAGGKSAGIDPAKLDEIVRAKITLGEVITPQGECVGGVFENCYSTSTTVVYDGGGTPHVYLIITIYDELGMIDDVKVLKIS